MMLIKMIDEYLQNRPRQERRTRCFHPSSLHRDEDYLFHAYFNGTSSEKYEPRILRVFDNGHAVHSRLQGYLKEMGLLLDAEVEVWNEEFEIYGHCDGVLQLADQKGILEIKSINSNGFWNLYSPKPEHLVQVHAYMFALGIPRGVLLYEEKDGQHLKNFFVKEDPVIRDGILGKIRRVQKRIQQESEGGKHGFKG
jgi:hypothetical protein